MIRNEGLSSVNVMDMLTGKIPGTIGETSVIAILIGAMILILLGVITLRIPAAYLVTFAVFMLIFGKEPMNANYLVAELVRWWSDAWCILYGNRLCDFTDYTGRSDYLRYLLWSVNRYFPLFRSKCRGCFFCNHPEQYFSTDY